MGIEGVIAKKLNQIPDDRGFLMEILRSDDAFFKEFGQCYVSSANPGIVKAWHKHQHQTDHLACIKGNAKVGLYDEENKVFETYFIGEQNPVLLRVPKRIYHGFTALGNKPCVILYIPDKLYNYKNPDELRAPFDAFEYEWLPKSR